MTRDFDHRTGLVKTRPIFIIVSDINRGYFSDNFK